MDTESARSILSTANGRPAGDHPPAEPWAWADKALSAADQTADNLHPRRPRQTGGRFWRALRALFDSPPSA